MHIMNKKSIQLLSFFLILPFTFSAQTTFPFQNTSLPDSKRVENLLSLMTLDEKVNALSTNLGVPRLGIRNTGHSEGLHGMALGGPGNWGGSERGVIKTYPTTTFPQAYGLGETWDPELIQKVKEELYETFASIKVFLPYQQGQLISLFHEAGQIERIEHTRGGVMIHGRIPGRLVAQFNEYQANHPPKEVEDIAS